MRTDLVPQVLSVSRKLGDLIRRDTTTRLDASVRFQIWCDNGFGDYFEHIALDPSFFTVHHVANAVISTVSDLTEVPT
jgi:hypothetical protein